MPCEVCDDTGWICESIRAAQAASAAPSAAALGAVGIPILNCIKPAPGERPRMAGFAPRDDADDGFGPLSSAMPQRHFPPP